MRAAAIYIVGFVVLAGAVILTVAAPLYAGVAIAGLAGMALMRFPVGRLAMFILGGLALMGGSSGLGPTKIAYALIVVACFAISWWRITHPADDRHRLVTRLALYAAAVMLVAIILASVVGYSVGYEPTLIAQDAFTYVLIAVAPIVGLDAGTSGNSRAVHTLTVAAGSVAAISWAVWWLARRGSSIGGLERLTMVTSFLGFAAVAIALVMAVNARTVRARVLWGAFGIAVPLVYILAGSRSMIVFALGLVGLVGAARFGRLPPVRALLLAAVAFGIALVTIPVVILAVPDGPRILERFTRTFALIENDSLASDGSAIERARAYDFTRVLFEQSPLLGQGFGHTYPSVSGETAGDLKVDSPLLILSKFGIIGTLAVLAFLVLIWLMIRTQRGPGDLRLGETVLQVFLWISVFRAIFVAPTEDKGFAYAIALMVCFSVIVPRFPDGFRRTGSPSAEAGMIPSATRRRSLARTR